MPKAGNSKAAVADRRKLFVQYYIANGGNGTQAAISAGYAVVGAAVTASRLLKRAKTQAAIAKAMEKHLQKAEASAERTVLEMTTIAYGTPDEPLPWAAKVRALELLSRHQGLFERDNNQRMPNLAIQVNLVGPEPKPVVDAKRLP